MHCSAVCFIAGHCSIALCTMKMHSDSVCCAAAMKVHCSAVCCIAGHFFALQCSVWWMQYSANALWSSVLHCWAVLCMPAPPAAAHWLEKSERGDINIIIITFGMLCAHMYFSFSVQCISQILNLHFFDITSYISQMRLEVDTGHLTTWIISWTLDNTDYHDLDPWLLGPV